MSGADEGTIIHAIAYFLGGTVRWILASRRQPYLTFIKSETEMSCNLKWGYSIFFSLAIGLTLFWYFAFKPGT